MNRLTVWGGLGWDTAGRRADRSRGGKVHESNLSGATWNRGGVIMKEKNLIETAKMQGNVLVRRIML